MRIPFLLLLGATFVAPAIAALDIQTEVGASYFIFRDTRREPMAGFLGTDEPTKAAPFIAVATDLTENIGLRLSYQFVNDVSSTARFSSPSGAPSLLPTSIWSVQEDDIHLLGLAPEFKWKLAPSLSLALAPELHWVASRGVVSYGTNNPAVSLVAPRTRNDNGFTLGGAARARWSISRQASVSLGYEYVDLDPSFGRRAHVIAAGFGWRF